jgi:ureidoacrylate peracid hydrolase
MQNAYASKGGYLDLLGVDLSNIATVIEAIKSAIAASRKAGMQIVFCKMGGAPTCTKPVPRVTSLA